ncbi:unnamed protein product [Protopolystoma xenopodis]|uniref:Uncharacterized protein n=1 Tax=Protopolystoma xenopodis TaxID=117903 RepID=A0A448WVR1_9PLAT|nr:unnamed protein product [Protopolystoma xenopodis]
MGTVDAGLYPCAVDMRPVQIFGLSLTGMVRRETICLTVGFSSSLAPPLQIAKLMKCPLDYNEPKSHHDNIMEWQVKQRAAYLARSSNESMLPDGAQLQGISEPLSVRSPEFYWFYNQVMRY